MYLQFASGYTSGCSSGPAPSVASKRWIRRQSKAVDRYNEPPTRAERVPVYPGLVQIWHHYDPAESGSRPPLGSAFDPQGRQLRYPGNAATSGRK